MGLRFYHPHNRTIFPFRKFDKQLYESAPYYVRVFSHSIFIQNSQGWMRVLKIFSLEKMFIFFYFRLIFRCWQRRRIEQKEKFFWKTLMISFSKIHKSICYKPWKKCNSLENQMKLDKMIKTIAKIPFTKVKMWQNLPCFWIVFFVKFMFLSGFWNFD